MFKISSSSTLAVIVHICIDGARCYFTWMICRICRVGDINFSPHSISFCLSSSPPSPSLPPSFHLSSAVLGWSATIFKVALDLWEYSSLSSYGWTDPHTLLLYRGQVSVWDTRSFTHTPLLSCGMWQIYNTSAPKKAPLNNKKYHFPCECAGLDEKTFCFLLQQKQRDFIPTNWESTCLVLFVQTLVTHRPEYSQRSDVRQAKQDRPFRLIRVLIVIDLLSFLQTEVQEYFYHFTVKQLLSSDCFGSVEAIWLFSVGSDLASDWFVCSKSRNKYKLT